MVIQVHVNHLFILEIKYMIQGNVRRGTIRRGNVCLGICPFGKLSLGQLSVGELSQNHLDHGDMVSDQHNNDKLWQRIESMQYNAALAITQAIKGTSQTKLCQELGLKSLKLSDVRLGDFVPYLKLDHLVCQSICLTLLLKKASLTNTSSTIVILTYCYTCFISFAINEWNKLNFKTRNTESLLSFGRPLPKSNFNIHSLTGLKLLTRLRLGPSPLNNQRFYHNFLNCVNPLCSCSLEI